MYFSSFIHMTAVPFSVSSDTFFCGRKRCMHSDSCRTQEIVIGKWYVLFFFYYGVFLSLPADWKLKGDVEAAC